MLRHRTTVCSSSMKVMIWPSASRISVSTAFSRSSNSPRYFAPATIADRSRETSRRPFNESGTSPATSRCARPRRQPSCRHRLADQHRVVLRAAGQHLHDPADLGVPTDHRVELALASQLGEVDTVLVQRRGGALSLLRRDPLAPARGV